MIQGAIVGVGAILPGVSGGVLCVAFGIYEPMMELLTNPKDTIKKSYKMFIPFIIGWVVGFILLARAIEILFATSAAVALMLFFGFAKELEVEVLQLCAVGKFAARIAQINTVCVGVDFADKDGAS